MINKNECMFKSAMYGHMAIDYLPDSGGGLVLVYCFADFKSNRI